MRPTLILVLGLALAAPLGTARGVVPVFFSVDGEPVMTLNREGGFRGYIFLSGQSGPDGGDDRSGLYDNVWVSFYWNAHGCGIEDEFGVLALDEFHWIPYGEAEPQLVGDFGNPLPCLMSSGDSLAYGGVYWYDFINFDGGQFSFAVDVYVRSAAEFHSVLFGVVDEELVPRDPLVPGSMIGVYLGLSSAGQCVLRCLTDIDSMEVPAAELVGAWHTIRFYSDNSSPVEGSTWTRVKAMYL